MEWKHISSYKVEEFYYYNSLTFPCVILVNHPAICSNFCVVSSMFVGEGMWNWWNPSSLLPAVTSWPRKLWKPSVRKTNKLSGNILDTSY